MGLAQKTAILGTTVVLATGCSGAQVNQLVEISSLPINSFNYSRLLPINIFQNEYIVNLFVEYGGNFKCKYCRWNILPNFNRMYGLS